jgi:hypothetical protein
MCTSINNFVPRHSLFDAGCASLPNGMRFSRREASAASEAVGWKRLLGGVVL